MKFIIATILVGMGFQTWAGTSATSAKKIIELQVTEKGFDPSQIDVAPGTQVTLKVTRKTDATCATSIVIPSQKIKKDLPLNQTVSIDLGKLDKGEVRFACGMKMMEGQIAVH